MFYIISKECSNFEGHALTHHFTTNRFNVWWFALHFTFRWNCFVNSTTRVVFLNGAHFTIFGSLLLFYSVFHESCTQNKSKHFKTSAETIVANQVEKQCFLFQWTNSMKVCLFCFMQFFTIYLPFFILFFIF